MNAATPPFEMRPELVHVPTEIRTDRLVIRPWRQSDAEPLFDAIDRSRATLLPWLPWVEHTTDVDGQRVTIARFESTWITRDDLVMGVFSRNGDVLGGTGLHRMDWKLRAFEIGYWLASDAVGHGYMSESTAALTRMAFEVLDAQRVEIRLDPRNVRSRAIPERLGYVHEGTLRADALGVDGTLRDTEVFSLVGGDELPSHQSAGNATWS